VVQQKICEGAVTQAITGLAALICIPFRKVVVSDIDKNYSPRNEQFRVDKNVNKASGFVDGMSHFQTSTRNDRWEKPRFRLKSKMADMIQCLIFKLKQFF